MSSNLQLKAFLFGLIGALFGASLYPLFSLFFPWFEESASIEKPEAPSSYVSTAELQKKIKNLSAEIARVKEYEQQLIHKSDLLDSVLREIEELDPSSHDSENTDNDQDSIGGSSGDENEANSSYSRSRLSSNHNLSFFLPSLSKIKNISKKRYQDASTYSKRLDNSSYLEENSFLENYFHFEEMLDGLQKRIQLLGLLPFGLPTTGRLTSGFGFRNSPFGGGKRRMHKGLDIAATMNMEVKATAPGRVIKAGRFGGYGNTVIIKHASGFETLFGHLDRITVKVGDQVCRGEQVGQLGSTGRSTGPHLHYEVRKNGQHKNPLRFAKFNRFLNL